MKVEEMKEKLAVLVPELANALAPIYQLLNWEWSPGKTAPHIPDVKELEETLHKCIDGLSDEYVSNGSGGLEAFYEMPSKGESGRCGIRFTLSRIEFFD